MKIVLMAPEADRPNGEGSYAYQNMRAPLLALGHDIIDIDFRAGLKQRGREGLGQYVKELIDREQPELFFHMVFEDELLPEIAQYITHKTPTVAAAFFSDDDWRVRHSLQVIPHYNFGLTTAKQAVPVFHDAGCSNVILTQYAASTDLYYPVDGVAKRYDVSFVGQAYLGRPEMVTWLREQGVSIKVWGQGWERIPALRDCAGGFLPHAELLNVFAASKIVLGMSWTSDGKALQIKGRIFEYASAGVFQLSTQDDRLADYFDIGKEIALYRDEQDLLAKVRHYLAHDDERTRIAQAGRDRVLKHHTWLHRFEQMFEAMNRQLPAGKRRLSYHGTLVSARRTGVPHWPKPPKVSVLCTVYNGEEYLDTTIKSVLNQDFADWELILFDDGSTDRTREIVMAYAHDPRVRYLYHSNIAQSGTAFDRLLNTCMEYVRGEYVAFIGADDVFLPEKLSTQLAELASDPGIDIVFSDGAHIDASGRVLPTDFRFAESSTFTPRSLLRTLFRKNIVPHLTALIRRDTIERLGRFETGFCPDYQFWLKAARFCRFKYLDVKLAQYRIHDRGISTGPSSKTLPETVKLLSLMRDRVTIHELYPEIDECQDKNAALYSAYVHFGLSLLTANIPAPQQALIEYQRALEHRGDGLEAINNLGVTLAVLGALDKAEVCFQFTHSTLTMPPEFEHNRAVLRLLMGGAKTIPEGFQLLAQEVKDHELLRRLDTAPDMQINRHVFGGLISSIHPFTPHAQVTSQTVVSPRLPEKGTPSIPGTITASKGHEQKSGTAPQPMVSIIVPTHNRPQQLAHAIASILGQTYQDFEIIVVNDAGCDVESALAQINTGGKLTYAKHAVNRGLAAARNTGIKLARGKYIAYLDDDDRFLPTHLETLVTRLETSDYRVAYSDAWRVHEELQGDHYVETTRDVPYSYEFDATRLLISNYFPVLSVMHERTCLTDTGLFDETLTSHEDWDLWIRLSRRFPFTHIKQVTAEFTWRTDGSSMTSRIRPDFARTAETIFKKYRAISETIPGVCDLQAQWLREFAKMTASENPAYTCSIIIPVWNKAELTKQCLVALAAATTDVSFELIVVDNGSTDETQNLLQSITGDVQIIRNDENLGFAKACNQGARAARGQYLVFLNNDTIPQPNWLRPLVSEVEEHPEVGIVGSKLLYADGTIQHAGVVLMRTYLSPYHVYRTAPAHIPAVNQRREFQAVTAACMLVRRDVFNEVKGFDEGYINGFEDVDLCLKVGETGRHVIYQPRSVVYHLESQTPGRNAHEEDNDAYLRQRWGSHWWVGDEDFHYHTDGFKLIEGPQDEKYATQLRPMKDVHDRAIWAHVAAAQASAIKKDWAGVRRELKLVQDWPRDAFVLSWAATVCEKLGELDLQQGFLTRYLELKESPSVRLSLVRALIGQKDLPAAERHLSKLLSHSPDNAEGLLLRGILSMQREQYREAEAAFSSALRQGADRKKCLMGMGMASLGCAYAQGAWERFLQVLSENPDDAEAIHWLLRAGTAQNRWSELGQQLRNYLSRNPGDLAARFALASVLVRADQIDAARREHDALRVLAPTYDGLAELGHAITGKETVLAMEAAHSEGPMARALVIPLARLGDLLQTMPAIAAIKAGDPTLTLDLLCPSQLAPIGRMLPGITNVLEWNGTAWQQRASAAGAGLHAEHIREAEHSINALSPDPYDCAYVLNQHPRALLAGSLLAREMKGPRLHGPLSEQLTPWASYVREVATTRRGRRVHLADAFCGLCGVAPLGRPIAINFSPCPLPPDLDHIGKQGGPWIGLIVGAGDAERLVPIEVWQQCITRFLRTVPRGRIVLVGQERERGEHIQHALPPSVLGRIWDATGRTTLPELATILARCHTVIGADTGPLHLAAAVGTSVIGWYFARARVHETGPYGAHHLIWQAVGTDNHGATDMPIMHPNAWPIEETITALVSRVEDHSNGWTLWTSHCDQWGAFYAEAGQQPTPPRERETLWRELQPALR